MGIEYFTRCTVRKDNMKSLRRFYYILKTGIKVKQFEIYI